MDIPRTHYTGFVGQRCIASGELAEVALKAKELLDQGELSPIIIFDDETGRSVELDFRGTPDDVLSRLAITHAGVEATKTAPPQRSGPGRPKLGVVSREVTLLPRHWEWLNSQPGGASVTLRKLVEKARRESQGADRIRCAQEAAFRFMNTMAGNLPDYEDALRAFYAHHYERMDQLIQAWPEDIRTHTRRLITVVRHAENANTHPEKNA